MTRIKRPRLEYNSPSRLLRVATGIRIQAPYVSYHEGKDPPLAYIIAHNILIGVHADGSSPHSQ